jgi:hypothetical protein
MPFITTCTRCGHNWQQVFAPGTVPANAVGTDKSLTSCIVCQYLSATIAAALLAVAPTVT